MILWCARFRAVVSGVRTFPATDVPDVTIQKVLVTVQRRGDREGKKEGWR